MGIGRLELLRLMISCAAADMLFNAREVVAGL
jgi:hypothetical protein